MGSDALKVFETEKISARYWLELPKGAGELIHFADTTLAVQLSWHMNRDGIPFPNAEWDRRWDGIYYSFDAGHCGPKYHKMVADWFKTKLKEWKKERRNYLP